MVIDEQQMVLAQVSITFIYSTIKYLWSLLYEYVY